MWTDPNRFGNVFQDTLQRNRDALTRRLGTVMDWTHWWLIDGHALRFPGPSTGCPPLNHAEGAEPP